MELDPRKTLLSIDGVGAFDHIKRKAMMEALYTNPELAPVLPFVRLFYGKDSKYVCYDEEGLPHEICQGEGGEQGDPLMLSSKSMPPCVRVRCFSPTSTTYTCCAILIALQRYLCRSGTLSTTKRGSKLTSAKPKSGMVRPSNPRTCTSLELRLGKAKDLRKREVLWCWECQSGTALSSRNGLSTRRGPTYNC